MGQQDRSPDDVQGIARARDVTYGLFSMFFVGFIAFATPKNASEDPLIKSEYDAVQEVTTWIIQRLEQVTEHGKKTAPTMSVLLEPLEADIGPPPTSQSGIVRNPDTEIKRTEIKRLKALYADWEPIYKWEGVEGNSGVGGSPPAP